MGPRTLASLSNEELVYLIQYEDASKSVRDGAFEELSRRLRSLIDKSAAEFYLPGYSVTEKRQEALVGLYDACTKYESGRGARFKTFAELVIRRRLIGALQRTRTHSNRIVNTSERFEAESEDEYSLPERLAVKDNYLEVAPGILSLKYAALTPLQQQVYHLWLMGFTLDEMQPMTGLSKAQISSNVNKAKTKVRKALNGEYGEPSRGRHGSSRGAGKHRS